MKNGENQVGDVLITNDEGKVELKVDKDTDVSGYVFSVTEKNHKSLTNESMADAVAGGTIKKAMEVQYNYTISGAIKEMMDGSAGLQPVEGVTVTIVTDDTTEPVTTQSCTTGADGTYSINVTFAENQTSMSWVAEKIGYAIASGTLEKGDTTLDETEDTETGSKYLCMTACAKKNLKITATTGEGENKLQLENATVTLKGYNLGTGVTQNTVEVSADDISTTFNDLYVNGDYTVTVKKDGYVAVTQTITQGAMEAVTENDMEVEVSMKAFGFEKVTTENSPFSVSWKESFENVVSSVEGVVNPTYSIIGCIEDADSTQVSAALDKYAEIDNAGKVTVKDLTQVSEVKLPVVLTVQAVNGTESAETASYQLKITKAEQQLTWSSEGIADDALYYGVKASVTAASLGSEDIIYTVLEGTDYIEINSDGTISYKKEVEENAEITVTIKASRATDALYKEVDTDEANNNYTFTLKRRKVTEVDVKGSYYENGPLSETTTTFNTSYYYDTTATEWKLADTGWFVENTITISKAGCKISEELLSVDSEDWKESISFNKENYIGKSFYVKMSDGSISQKITMSAMNWDNVEPQVEGTGLGITYSTPIVTLPTLLSYYSKNIPLFVTFTAKDTDSQIAYFEWGYVDADKNAAAVDKYTRVEVKTTENGVATSFPVSITQEKAMHIDFIAYDKAGNRKSYRDTTKAVIYDETAPMVKVLEISNKGYYNTDKTAMLQVTESNFDASKVEVKVTAKNNEGSLAGTTKILVGTTETTLDNLTEAVKNASWSNSGEGIYKLGITFKEEADYTISVQATDIAGNTSDLTSVQFGIDKTEPSDLNIAYSACNGEKTTDGITLKYYQKAMDVTFTAKDMESGIDVVEYKLTGENDYREIKNFTVSDNVAVGSIEIENADNMQVVFKVIDKAGNSKSYKDNVRIVIDEADPVVAVDYAEDTAVNDIYYTSDRIATITVTEKNFDAKKVTVKIETKDINGNEIKDATVILGGKAVLASQLADEVQKADWKKSGNTYSLTITFNEDAYYTISVSAKDLAGRSSNKVKNSFCIDQTRPSGLKIAYSTPVLEKILEKITFGYYKSSATITFTATDSTAGIESLSWKYQRAEDASSTNLAKEEGTVSSDDITYSKDKKTATVKIKLTAKEITQYRGNMSFTVVDKAGNSKSYKDSGEEIVIDNISPTMQVSYTPVNETGSTAYFNNKAVLNFEITEANFEPEEVNIQINNKDKQCKNWKQVEGTDIWKGSITLNKDGDYKVTVAYEDRSSNKMQTYTSKTFVVDTQSPVIEVVYDKNDPVNTRDNIAFYDTTRTATISITDKNFRAKDVEAVVTAAWVDGSDVEVTDYNSYLKQASNWKQNGDVHTAVISYNVDANYTFDISYTDMAKNQAADYKTESFTVDTTAPENLQISYSQSVLDTILENISFGFYDGKVTVTITAEDSVAGVDYFSYSYKKAEAVSGVNNELIDQTIDASQITYTNGNKTATAQFEVPKYELDANNQFNGTVEFMAADNSGNKNQTADYRRIVVDNIAPTAEVTYNSPTSSANGIDYYAEAVEGQITITEANFQASDVEVSATKDGAPYALSVSWSDASEDVHNGTFQISEDGDYMITIQYQDKSGNTMTSYESNQLTVDSTTPTITVEGIANGTAYNEETIGLRVYVDDVNLDVSSFKPVLTAIVREEDGNFAVKDYSELGNITAVEDGKAYAYVIENITEDAIYTLSCAVADLSSNEMREMTVAEGGNEGMESVMFSVNRNGSTFMLDTATQEVVGNYYVQMVEENVVLKEINCDPITEHQVTVNGEALQENADYQVMDNRGENTWYQYDYSINKEMFEEEGNYTVVVASTDKAQNVAYSDMKNVEAAFVVDRTAPVVTVSGLAENGRYQVETQTVSIIPTDDGGKLQSLEVNIYDRDDNLMKNAVAMEGEALLEHLESNSGKVVFEIPQGVNQKISIACTDAAGNAAPIEDSTYDNVTVSTEWYIMLLANKALLYGGAAGVVAVGGGTGFGIHFLRKRKIK